MGPIRAVIFDVDGTLVDSNDQHARAWVEALAEYGYKVTFEQVRPLIGMGGDKVLPILTGLSADEPKSKKIAERRDAIFADKYLPQVRALPGARDLLLRLKGEGLKLAVASSSAKDLLKRLLNIVGAPDVFEKTASGDDAEDSKPDPDIVHAALKSLEAAPDTVAMIGDTPYDVEAARRAKVQPIAFRSGGWKDEDLKDAIEIHDGPQDLLQGLDDSAIGPAASRTSGVRMARG
jgi:HAD superfamily hydrolase (TIGR01509 family)